MKARSQILNHGLLLVLLAPQWALAKDDRTSTLPPAQIESTGKGNTSLSAAMKTYLGFNNAEIIKQNTRSLLAHVEGVMMSIQDATQIESAIRNGDTVIMNYELSDVENLAEKTSEIESEISKKEKIIEEAKQQKEKLLAKKNLTSRESFQVINMENTISKNEMMIRLDRDVLNKIKTGQMTSSPRRVATLSSDMDSRAIEKFLSERLDNQTRLVTVKALSAKGIKAARLARLRGVGAMGLVSLVIGGGYILSHGDEESAKDVLVFKPELIQPAQAEGIN